MKFELLWDDIPEDGFKVAGDAVSILLAHGIIAFIADESIYERLLENGDLITPGSYRWIETYGHGIIAEVVDDERLRAKKDVEEFLRRKFYALARAREIFFKKGRDIDEKEYAKKDIEDFLHEFYNRKRDCLDILKEEE